MRTNKTGFPGLSKRLLERLRPDRDILLRTLAQKVDNGMLSSIARADYGSDFDPHYRALLLIRDRLEVGIPLPWHPREVLELTRWGDPDDPSDDHGLRGEIGHTVRAFCCAVLLRAGADAVSLDYLASEVDTLAVLLASLRHLPEEVSTAALSALTFRLMHYDESEDERPFFLLALLWLVLNVHYDLEPPDIAQIAAWLVRDERELAMQSWRVRTGGSHSWLLGLTCFDQRHEVWQSLGAELPAFAHWVRGEQVRIRIARISKALQTGELETGRKSKPM